MLQSTRSAKPCGSAAGMGEEGRLAPERIEHAVATAEVFAAFCRASGVKEIDAVGTSAIRDAVNRDELIDAVRERTGIKVRVISGEEEARYGWLALANSTTVSDGFGLDMGGGGPSSSCAWRAPARGRRVAAARRRTSERSLPARRGTPPRRA